jgi:predicted  nucleic acid-binding Zn-ribbon protein
LLSRPRSEVAPATCTIPEPPPTDDPPKTEREEAILKARVVFGSRLAGPAERRSEIDRKSTNIAGIIVPPRPEEPDNCCMSGCVNCVWDIYRDDLEEWAAKSAQAREAMLTKKAKTRVGGTGSMKANPGTPSHVATSMDDDGGGSDTNWDISSLAADGTDHKNLFDDIPVGIREFMRTEKLLKERHKQERAQA